ncbi:hypothetical protein [Herpetosiphon geysericola]|uniref:Gram-positive cocci surface proteins LPxTG domain-containing protein n=1 Tax=Herpetosiphon geysericola TaxID=70996 RepID=A0A0P6YK84_9CHLR|nr:hypothetical protein [Herpetosiphon geysericola]KPL85597.1 hypothetical protein SE18_18495 [Herpetosiphon geysericola]
MRRLLVVIVALAMLLLGNLAQSIAAQGDGHQYHAAVVVQYASGAVDARCVGFDQESISGYDALLAAGFNVVAEGSSMGAMVCSIDSVGCDYPNESCACKCQGGDCTYWAYSHLIDGVWQYSKLGAGSSKVRDGAVEGWAWGGGSVERGSTPPVISWGEVCAAQAAPVATTEPPTAIPATEIPATATNEPTAIPATNTVAPTLVADSPTITLSPTSAATTPLATQTEPSATNVASPTVAPTEQATATSAPTATNSVVSTPSPEPSSGGSNIVNYLMFGLIVLALAGAGIWKRQSKR